MPEELDGRRSDWDGDYVHSNLSVADWHGASLVFIRYFGISAYPATHISKQNIKHGEFKPFLVHALDSDVPTQEFWKQRGTRFRAVRSIFDAISFDYV